MKKIALILCVMLNFVFSSCRIGSGIDEMTDKKESFIVCKSDEENTTVIFFLYEKERVGDVSEKLNTVFILPKGTILDKKTYPNDYPWQNVEIRIDKNKYFETEAWVYDDREFAVFFTEEQIKEILNGKKLLIRYYMGGMPETKKIDISEVKNFK